MRTVTMHHIHYCIPSILKYSDKDLADCVTHPDGMDAARKDLSALVDDGVTCLVLDSECDSKKADGSCAGHVIHREDE